MTLRKKGRPNSNLGGRYRGAVRPLRQRCPNEAFGLPAGPGPVGPRPDVAQGEWRRMAPVMRARHVVPRRVNPRAARRVGRAPLPHYLYGFVFELRTERGMGGSEAMFRPGSSFPR